MSNPDRATVRIPGSTSNIGPGYDCLGISLALCNEVVVSRADRTAPEHPMVEVTAALFFERSGVAPFPFAWEISGDVPISRGLGSSVTLRLGVLMGLDVLAGEPLDRDSIFDLCTELEGHPDNAGPGVYGGFVVANASNVFRFDVGEELKFVLLVPSFEVLTDEARKVLPTRVPHREAVENVGNASCITAAFASKNYRGLQGAFSDYLHQPYRGHLVPGLWEALKAGMTAGALGGFLSGSGSSLACITLDGDTDPWAVAEAMRASHSGFSSAETMVLTADNGGARVVGDE